MVGNYIRESTLTVEQVARLLGTNIETVRNWCNKGIIRPTKITTGGKQRFKLKDIAYFMANRKKTRGAKER